MAREQIGKLVERHSVRGSCGEEAGTCEESRGERRMKGWGWGAREERWEKGEKEGAMCTRGLGDTWRGGAFTVRHRKTEREREHTGRELRRGGRREEPSRRQTGTWERQWEAGESRERKYREKGMGEGRVRKRQDRQQERGEF